MLIFGHGRSDLTDKQYQSARTTWVGRSAFVHTFTTPSLVCIEAALSVKFRSSSTSLCAA
jgi:anaerobic C4-dicarboxylate transporter